MFKLTKIPAFGFLQTNAVVGTTKFTPSMAVWHNVRKIVGYIPGLSLIQGIEHLVRAMQNKKDYSSHFIFRSIVEMLGFGFFLLIPDIIVTCVRQQKSVPPTLQHRKIVPVPTPQPIVNTVFPDKIQEFVQTPKVRPQKSQPVLDPIVEAIKQKYRALAQHGQSDKLKDYLENSQLDLKNKASIKSLKQLALEEKPAPISIELVCYLFTNGALTESVEDVDFYRTLGIKLAEADQQPAKLCHGLNLDLSQAHSLKAITDIAMTEAKSNLDQMDVSIHKYGLSPDIAEQRAALFEIAKVAVQHNPARTLNNLKDYKMTEPEEVAALQKLAYVKGSLEEKKAKAIKLASLHPKYLEKNWEYFNFNLEDQLELQAVKEIALESYVASGTLAFRHIAPPLSPAVDTNEQLAFWRWFALEVAKKDYYKAVELIDLLALSPQQPTQKALIEEIGVALIKQNPALVLKDHSVFGIDGFHLEILKIAQEPFAVKKALLRKTIKNAPATFFDNCQLLLNDTEEELALKKMLTVKLIAARIELLKSDHYDKETIKEMILAAAAEATDLESSRMLKKLQSQILEKLAIGALDEANRDFYGKLAGILAKKHRNFLKMFPLYIFNSGTEEGFKVLYEVGLSAAALDGETFKKDFNCLGLDLANDHHAKAIKEMLALAIANDGNKNLKAFGKLAPQPNVQVLTLKQVCNLVAVHAQDKRYDPIKYFAYSKQEWDSPQGIAALEELIARLAKKSLTRGNVATCIDYALDKLPDIKKAALSIAEQDKEGLYVKLAHRLLQNHDEAGANELLLAYSKRFGPTVLTNFSVEFGKSKAIPDEEYFALFKLIVSINSCLKQNYYGCYEKGKLLVRLALKKGDKTEEEKLAEAIHEASFGNVQFYENLSYYQLKNELPALAKYFSVKPIDSIQSIKFASQYTLFNWDICQKRILMAAKEMGLEQLLACVDPLLELSQTVNALDFDFELAKILAAKGAEQLPIKKFKLDPQQLEEVVAIAYLENQQYTLNYLKDFGVAEAKMNQLKAKLIMNCQITGSLQERTKKALDAISRNHAWFYVFNKNYYFTKEEFEQGQVPQEVAQACLNATYQSCLLRTFDIKQPELISQMLTKAAKEAPQSYKLLDYGHELSSADLRKLILLIAERYPCEVLPYLKPFKLQLSNAEELAFLTSILKLASKVNGHLTLGALGNYKWDVSKADQRAALIEILPDVIKQVGNYEYMPCFGTSWKMDMIWQALGEAVPSAIYQGVKLY